MQNRVTSIFEFAVWNFSSRENRGGTDWGGEKNEKSLSRFGILDFGFSRNKVGSGGGKELRRQGS